MRDKNRAPIPSKIVFGILMISCILIIFFSYATGFSGGALNVVANYLFVPIQKGVTVIADKTNENLVNKKTIEELSAENEELKRQIEELNETLNQTVIAQSELKNLQELYKIDKQYADYKTVGARIIASSDSNWFNSFTIDKGSDDGLEVNMNVIAAGGLVGIITEVSDRFSVVSTIIDDKEYVSATVISSGDNCIVNGSLELIKDNGNIIFTDLDDDFDVVSVGDSIVTSNISDKYVPGIMIGNVTFLKEDDNGLTKSGRLIPAVDFKHLSEVLVILNLKEGI